MERYGLSQRGAANVEAIWPRIENAVAERERLEDQCIDMATSENWLLRDELIQLYKDAIRENFFGKHLSYPNGFAGDQDLLDAIEKFFNSYFNPRIPVAREHIATAPGAAFSLDALLYNIGEAGDGLLITTPAWNGFDWLIKVKSGIHPVFVTIACFEDIFTPKLIQALEDAFDQSPYPIKGLLFTNPNNPFGQAYPKETIVEIIKWCDKRKIHLISDEIYALSKFPNPDLPDPVPFISLLEIDIVELGCDLSRMHTIWSISKDLGSSGLRMMSSLTAIATTSLLLSPELPRLLKLNSQRLTEAYVQLTTLLRARGLRWIPANMGPFILVKVAPSAKTWEDEAAVIQACKGFGVSLSLGRGYHGPESEKGWARLNFALAPGQLTEALRRLSLGLDSVTQQGVSTQVV
ncbi:hypothetical protein TruAng_008420 [Truncatella angustata]|nr:hypothetical protein TruAng_008420 [Truncatella angustata]